MKIDRLFAGLAIALAALFAGAALFITLAEQPARLTLTDAPALAEWKRSYEMAMPMQASLALLAGLAGLIAWRATGNWRWILGAVLILANWPWTLVIIAPINAALFAIAPDVAGPASRDLIEQWGRLHAGRTGLGLLATICFIWASTRSA